MKKFILVPLCGLLFNACSDSVADSSQIEAVVSNDTATTQIVEQPEVTATESYDAMGLKTEELILWPNGNVRYTGRYVEGKRDGVWMAFFESGVKQSENEYSLGEKHGKSAVFHENGQLYYIGYYQHNEKKGVWKFYDDKGTLVTSEDYGN